MIAFTPTKPPVRFILITFLLAFAVIVLGAYTRLTNAGLSCPDWPNCYGYLTAPHTIPQLQGALEKYPANPVDIKKAWTEMTHRYAAGTLGLLLMLLSGIFLFTRQLKNINPKIVGITLLFLLSIQVTLGMLTVTEQLKPLIVLAHLLTGILLLSTLWWSYLRLRKQPTYYAVNHSRIKKWLALAFLIVLGQIALGGWVSTHNAGLACVDFPYCNGNFLPSLKWNQLGSDLITIHMLHRLGAFITAIYLSFLAVFFIMKYPAFKGLGLIILGFVSLQFTLGIFNIIWFRPLFLALMHQTVAIFLLLSLITAWNKASYTKSLFK